MPHVSQHLYYHGYSCHCVLGAWKSKRNGWALIVVAIVTGCVLLEVPRVAEEMDECLHSIHEINAWFAVRIKK